MEQAYLYKTFSTSERQQSETQLDQVLVCLPVYGKAWIESDRRELYRIVCSFAMYFRM
jgi:hypothetical protein